MNVITPMLRPGARSLPAELMIPRQYRSVDWPMQRLLAGGPNRMQSYGGVRGIRGLGDMCFDPSTDQSYSCMPGDPNYVGAELPPIPVDISTAPITTIPSTDPNWAAITGAITAGSTSLAKILAASNPGTYYKDPSGNIIYSQPTGNTQNLPGIYGSGGFAGGAQGTINTGFGSATFGGVSSGTLMVGAVLLFAFMMMGRGR